ncbi:MBL fold metallo-hydrolase [Pararoseomonas sp. SCSIO 73927]|uniref:MBL fold metallo-hydrolase n=1 Tax=Pararoseomonas sp. SCSIO 73927 TaxID=3114537 RepID=UPI0030D0FD94
MVKPDHNPGKAGQAGPGQPGRRGLLAAGSLAGLGAAPAKGAAPFHRTAAPAWYRFGHSRFEMTVVSDGPLSVGTPERYVLGAAKGEIARMLQAAYLPTDMAVIGQNALVVNTGRHLVLFDTGMGESMGSWSRMFGPGTGRLLANLHAAGIDPGAIDLVALTHPHSDHCWALTDAEGRPNFPNAQVALSEADLAFWTDDGNKRGPEVMAARIEGAKRNLGAYRDRLVMVRDGQEVVPGVTPIAAPGHTVGHTMYAIESEGKLLVNTGDLANHHVLLLRRPRWEVAADTDRGLAARTRERMLDRLATDRTAILAWHFPWPGHGHIARLGDGYEYVPLPREVSGL